MVKAYVGILACPVTAVQNSSFEEQRRPSSWKMVPVPKLKPVIDINKNLCPISLTFVISKLARRSPFRPRSSGGDWSKSVCLHPSVLYPTRHYVHATYMVASHRRAWSCCKSRPLWSQEGLRSQRPHPACAQRFPPIFSSRCCPLGGRRLNA